ncbi:MAG TPA: peptidase S41 [Clostridia bacterium]|nr:peptidase S41 [Clostridia bacterium]
MKKLIKIVLTIFTIITIISLALYYGIINSPVQVVTKNLDIEKPLTIEQKLEDFEYMYNILKDNFPFFEVKKRVLGYDWLSRKSEFEEWIKETKNDKEFYDTMCRILNLLQNGHTHILSPQTYKDFSELYNNIPLIYGSGPWRQVLNNKNVIERYKYWSKIIDENKSYIIPIVFKYIEGKYVAAYTAQQKDLKDYGIERGSILQKVGDLTIKGYIDSLKDKKFLNYDFKRNEFKMNQLLIFTPDIQSIKLTLLTPEGEIIERDVKSVVLYVNSPTNTKNIQNYQTAIIKKDKVAYLKVYSLLADYKKDQEGIYKFFKEIKDYPYLIIDIRGNSGGNDMYWMENIVAPLIDKPLKTDYYMIMRNGEYINPFIKAKLNFSLPTLKSTKELPQNLNFPYDIKGNLGKFIHFTKTIPPKNPVGFKGKIFLLVDEYVYSSSESFASFAKATKWATLVGTATGGDGIGVDPTICALPNSGLIFRFPFDMGINPDGTINEEKHTQPDIYVEETYEDFINTNKLGLGESSYSNDVVIRKVLEMINEL